VGHRLERRGQSGPSQPCRAVIACLCDTLSITEVLSDIRQPTRSASDQRHVVALPYTLSRDTTTRTPCHGYYPFCPCWHPLVLSPGVDHSPLVNYRCRTLYSTTAVSDITFFAQAIDFIDKYVSFLVGSAFPPWTCARKRPKVSGRTLAARVEPHASSKISCVLHSSGQLPLPF
jgi:hypothetical protein